MRFKRVLGYSLVAVITILSGVLAINTDSAKGASVPALEAEGDSTAHMHNAEGTKHYKKGHWAKAEEHFMEAVGADAKLPEAHYNLALALDRLDRHGEATKHFKQALELAPDNPAIADSKILKGHLGM